MFPRTYHARQPPKRQETSDVWVYIYIYVYIHVYRCHANLTNGDGNGRVEMIAMVLFGCGMVPV